MKRLICLMAAALLLSGCSANIKPDTTAQNNATPAPYATKMPSYREVTLPLYFLSADGVQLISQMRQVLIQNDDTRAEASIKELIKGPEGDLGRVLPENVKLLSLEISKNVANVNFSREFLTMLDAKHQLAARVALACTLYDIDKVEYVNVFVENMETGYGANPIGTISYRKYASDLNLLYIKMQDTESGPDVEPQVKSQKFDIPLYFADIRGQYLLPEVRSVSVIDGSYIKTIIDELSRGPKNSTSYLPVIPQDLVLASEPSILVNTNGKKTIKLDFSKQTSFSSITGNSMALAYGSICYSLAGFIPDVENFDITQNGVKLTQIQDFAQSQGGIWTKQAFAPLIGNNILIYLPNRDKTRLLPVYRAVAQDSVRYAKTRIVELMRGPLLNEADDMWPVFPSGVSVSDIKNIYISGNTAILDLSGNFLKQCASISSASETALVYSIVNTLTEIPYINKVQFLIEGAPVDTLGSGSLYLRNPFIRNPGIINQQ